MPWCSEQARGLRAFQGVPRSSDGHGMGRGLAAWAFALSAVRDVILEHLFDEPVY